MFKENRGKLYCLIDSGILVSIGSNGNRWFESRAEDSTVLVLTFNLSKPLAELKIRFRKWYHITSLRAVLKPYWRFGK